MFLIGLTLAIPSGENRSATISGWVTAACRVFFIGCDKFPIVIIYLMW